MSPAQFFRLVKIVVRKVDSVQVKWVIATEQDKEFSRFSYFFLSDKTNQKGPCYNLSRSLIVSVDISHNSNVFVDKMTYSNSQILRHDTEWRIAPLGATELAVSCDHGDERFHGQVVRRCPNFARVMPGLEPKANLSKKQQVLRDISGEKEQCGIEGHCTVANLLRTVYIQLSTLAVRMPTAGEARYTHAVEERMAHGFSCSEAFFRLIL